MMGRRSRLKARHRIGAVVDTSPIDTASGVHHTATVDEEWDAGAARAAMPNEAATLRYCHAWRDPDGDPDAKSSYSFPHHKTKGGPANLHACRNGLARLSSAHIPDGEREGVRKHLQAHLDDANDAEDTMKSRTRAERTQAARERSAGHNPTCTCGVAPRSDNWFKVRNFVDQPNRAAIYIYDEIGYWGTTALEFVQVLNSLGVDYLDVHINSPGGEVDDGVAIFTALRQHKAHVTTYVDSLAASAASFIAMAGDKVCISEFGQLMIHDPMGIQFGNAAEMREFAELLDRYGDNIAAIYAKQAGGTVEQWREVMRVETWYTGAEAVTAGLVDMVHDAEPEPDEDEDEPMSTRMTARWDLSLFSYRYAGREAAPPPPLTNHAEAETSEPDAEATVDAPEPKPVTAEVVEPDAPAEDVEPVPEDSVAPEVPGSTDVETGLSGESAAVDSPVEPDPEPAEPADLIEPVEVDVFAQRARALLSAITAPSNPDDAFAALKEGLLS